MEGLCAFCKEPLDNAPTLRIGAGCSNLNSIVQKRQDDTLGLFVNGQTVHRECKKTYIHPSNVAAAVKALETQNESKALRSVEPDFQYSKDCLFCTQRINKVQKRKSLNYSTFEVLKVKHNLLRKCDERNDEWGNAVRARLLHIHDLVAAEGLYHKNCDSSFRTGRQIPTSHDVDRSNSGKKQRGRPKNELQQEAFLSVAKFLEENDDEQITIIDLVEEMRKYLDGLNCEPYSTVYLKERITEHFGDRIIITEIHGKPNVVTFRHTATSVLHSYYTNQKKNDIESEKIDLIQTAAMLLRSDIKCLSTESYQYYPASLEVESTEEILKFLPHCLKIFLETLFTGKNTDLKVGSIGQAIIQAVRPRVLLAPLQIGLAVQFHHLNGSEFIISSLHKHGFSASIDEVRKYERSAAVNHGTEIEDFDLENQDVEYAADNVDHDTCTLDGKNTLHGMGMIAAITPGKKSQKLIPRKVVYNEDIERVGRIDIKFYRSEGNGLSKVKYATLFNFKAEDPTKQFELFWRSSLLFPKPCPSWSGMMEGLHIQDLPGKSSIKFLPIIDLAATDMNCIYSTLCFIADHAKKHNVSPVLTFDQPLWFKATTIVHSEPETSDLKNIVLKLGGFHIMMSFLHSIGHIMTGSGLEELLELIYAPNAVKHMMAGKAVSRAIRGHLLVGAALNGILLSDHEFEGNESAEGQHLQEVYNLYQEFLEGMHSADQLQDNLLLKQVNTALEERKSVLKSRTSKLWLQYDDLLLILRKSQKADRTGNWLLGLEANSDMLPYLAATGHHHYVKSICLYLESMSKLQRTNPAVFAQFMKGNNVVYRTERQWAGIATDLAIEQVLMRTLKSTGGLTRGRGVSEIQRTTWLLGMPACAEMNRAMQELTNLAYDSGEQSRNVLVSHVTRDHHDTQVIMQALRERNVFSDVEGLRNIMNGVSASDNANVDAAKAVGQDILRAMNGVPVLDYKFSRKNTVTIMGGKATVTIDGQKSAIDPMLLFQRLTMVTKEDDLEESLKKELCSFPPALFESDEMLRKADKPALADAIWKMGKFAAIVGEDCQVVCDGGDLLYIVPWPGRGLTYKDICELYSAYIFRHYPGAIIIFDGGYTLSSTKDMTHVRRSKGLKSVSVHFTRDMHLTMKKEDFLSNPENKQRFIDMLTLHLREKGITVVQAPGDADLLITKTAVQCSRNNKTAVVGKDTDLLILLLNYLELDAHELFFKMTSKKENQPPRIWDLKAVHANLEPDILINILFVHGFMGCDTTAGVYRLGKVGIMKKLPNSAVLQNAAKVFMNSNSTVEEVVNAGEEALVCLYNGRPRQTLNRLRYLRYVDKVKKGTSAVHPQSIPPTASAAKFNSMRIFQQIQAWLDNDLDAELWGWRKREGRLVPITTDEPIAPEYLLKQIFCNCQMDCGTLKCTCRKFNLKCSVMCGHCRGVSCANIELENQIEDNDYE